MSRVFVVQNTHRASGTNGLSPKFDFSDAERFGELIFLLSPSARPFSPDHLVAELWEKLTDYSNDDFLLLVGNPALIGFAVAIASKINHGQVNVLQWSGGRYVPIRARLSDF